MYSVIDMCNFPPTLQDYDGNIIRKFNLTSGEHTILAGNGDQAWSDNVYGPSASFLLPRTVALSPDASVLFVGVCA